MATSACGGGSGGASDGADPGPDTPAVVSSDRSSGSWAGELAGTSGFVAIVADGERVAAYVCDDGTIGEWFFGPSNGREVDLESSSGAALHLSFEGGAARGLVTLAGGTVHEFTAQASTSPVLFRADAAADDEAQLVAGWIQLGDQRRGTLKTTTSVETTLQPAPSFDSASLLNLSPQPMTPDTLTKPATTQVKFVWAAMGDSYAAGEGNPARGISDPSDPENFTGLQWGSDASTWVPLPDVALADDLFTCHRSDQAGAPKANRRLKQDFAGMDFVLGFVACSGAITDDLRVNGYTGPGNTVESLLGHPKIPQPSQIRRVKEFGAAQGQLHAVYMSIGGNDVGFADFVTDCLAPLSDCISKWRDPTPEFPLAGKMHDRLAKLGGKYGQVAQTLSVELPNVPVLVSQYPNPIDNGGRPCVGADYDAHADVGATGPDDFIQDNITAEEAAFAFDVPERMNTVIRDQALRGWRILPVPDFTGHGLCTASPFANLNSRALRTQGRDLGGTFVFLVSAGLLHPNDSGYDEISRVIASGLVPDVVRRARTGLQPPTDVRIASAVANGALTVRWTDRATAENAFEIEVRPARSQDAALLIPSPDAVAVDGGGYRERISGKDSQQYLHVVSRGAGMFTYRVRACAGPAATSTCGSFSASVTGANFAPATPTGLAATLTTITSSQVCSGGLCTTVLTLKTVIKSSWQQQPGALEYVLRIKDGTSTKEVRTAALSALAEVSPVGGATSKAVAIAACNRVGCSRFSADVAPISNLAIQ